MAKTQTNSILTVILAMLGLCATIASADSNALRAVDLRAYEQTSARDDRDAGPADRIAAACGRLGHTLGCESLREISQRVNRRELEEVTEILERETGEAFAGNRNIIASYVSTFPSPGTNRGAHTVTRALLWKLESMKIVERDDANAGLLGRVHYESSAPLAWNASGNANPSSIARLDIEHITAIDVEDAEFGDWFRASPREMLSEQRVR